MWCWHQSRNLLAPANVVFCFFIACHRDVHFLTFQGHVVLPGVNGPYPLRYDGKQCLLCGQEIPVAQRQLHYGSHKAC